MTLYEYYARQSLLPTDGEFDLGSHELERRRLFTDRLALPPAVFREARLLEFGPDAGANAVVFAYWGAHCTLSEPNPNAHRRLEELFTNAGLVDRIERVDSFDVDAFPPSLGPYDVVDAEGFAYTLPMDSWPSKFAELLRPEGFAVVSYYAAPGTCFELLWKVAHTRCSALTGSEGASAAERLFRTKWDSIPHRRSLASWTMDVLENPLVRLRTFLWPDVLLERAAAAGFALHAAWPRYHDPFDVAWFKLLRDPEDAVARQTHFVRSSSLSYLLGRSHPATDDDLSGPIATLLEELDSLIDEFEPQTATRCGEALDALMQSVVSGTPEDIERSRRDLTSAAQLLKLLGHGDVAALEAFCGSDPGFIESWGSPCHFAVLRRDR